MNIRNKGGRVRVGAHGHVKRRIVGGGIKVMKLGRVPISVDSDDTNLQRLKGALRSLDLNKGAGGRKKKYISF